MKKLLAILPLLGAFLSRLHGGGFFKSPKVLNNILWSLPFAIVIGTLNLWLAPIAFAGCMLKAMAHGRGLGYDEPLMGSPNKIELPILWLQPSLTDHAYKFLIMTLKGFVSVSGGVIAFMFINPLSGAILAICGLLGGYAYELGLKLAGKMGFAKTEWGEILAGFFAYGGLAIGFIIA